MFIDASFPVTIAQGSQGGPQYSTTIVTLASGQEQRNSNWSYPRHEFDAASGVNDMNQLSDLIAFFHVVRGRAHSFRFKDWADFKSCDPIDTPSALDIQIGVGDNVETDFQLIKTYTFGGQSVNRNITKPVSGTVVVAVQGLITTAFTVDTDTGIVTMDVAPDDGEIITAGYEFDCHCRLDSDQLSSNLIWYKHGTANVPVIEIKE